MQYMLTFQQSAEAFDVRDDPKNGGEYMGAWGAYIGAMYGAGVVISGAGLQPPHTATTVRVRDGKRQVQDGPFADTRELLAGFFVIEVPTLDVALDWAARAPNASHGSVEVRPVMPPIPQAAA
jgi:hypothetical protein